MTMALGQLVRNLREGYLDHKKMTNWRD